MEATTHDHKNVNVAFLQTGVSFSTENRTRYTTCAIESHVARGHVTLEEQYYGTRGSRVLVQAGTDETQ